ncbi:MAG TPA: hypothetical protein VJC16_05560 [Candidatus Nanoarchaeia archaeon]|nr:hypothetical protein [Candidatus Nanoarchaeia archaeon]
MYDDEISDGTVLLCFECGADFRSRDRGLYLPQYKKIVCAPQGAEPESACLTRFKRSQGISRAEHEIVHYNDMLQLLDDRSIQQHDLTDLFL